VEIARWLPRGSRMSEESWQDRHRILTGFLWASVPVLFLVGVLGPMSSTEALLLPTLPAVVAACARVARTPRAQAELTSLGLIGGSFIGLELSGGQVHAHLFILSAVALVSLYQRWTPLLYTVGAVVVHHLVLGLVAPERVFNTSMGHASTMVMNGHPMVTDGAGAPSLGQVALMVGAHASAVILEVVAILLFWHFAEAAEREAVLMREQVEAQRLESDAAQARAAELEVAAERERTEQHAQVRERLSQDAMRIRERAEETVEAVAALDNQAAMLRGAVQEIAARAQQAAGTASTGQQTADAAAEDVRRLERAMGEIAEVNQMIAQLADQTNLLSLNATIEAARAGEMGKGFAVVAQEVKTLANETAASADKVRAVIDGVVEETGKVARSCTTTSTLVGEIHAAQSDIATSVEEQASVLAEVTRQTSTATEAARAITAALEQIISSASAAG